jgi:hypothetical protein
MKALAERVRLVADGEQDTVSLSDCRAARWRAGEVAADH